MKQPRNTVQRDLVLAAVRGMHNHPTADEIYQRVAAQYPSISKGTVYRNLAVLAELGEIRRVSHLNAADRFDFQVHDHYHFCCKGCGGVFDVDLAPDANLLAQVNNPLGFEFHSYDMVFTGLCPDCKKNEGTVS